MPVLGRYELCQENSIVILDNATIHHSEEIVRLIESKGAKIIYLPPYSPDLNPIELMFGVYKSALKRFVNEKLSVAHTFGLQAVTRDTANNFFFHCGIPLVQKLFVGVEDFEAVSTVVAAVVASSVTVVNVATIYFNNIKK